MGLLKIAIFFKCCLSIGWGDYGSPQTVLLVFEGDMEGDVAVLAFRPQNDVDIEKLEADDRRLLQAVAAVR